MKVQVWLKSNKNNVYFTWWQMYIYDNVSIIRMKNVSDRSCTENQNTHILFDNIFLKSVLFMR
jgi:hypothetical protein